MFNFYILIASLSTACFLSTAAIAQTSDPEGNNPVTRAELPALIKEILIKDPSILMEAAEKMQTSQQEESIKKSQEAIVKHKTELYSDPTSPVYNNAGADVTIVEFFDYHCGYCKKALDSLTRLLEKDKKVRIIFKEYPILSEESKLASQAALAVNRIAKDKYFDFHKAMFTAKNGINEKFISEEAEKLGINSKKLKTEMSNPEIEIILNKNKELGAAIGAMGTPAIIIGDNFYPGAIPYEAIQEAVNKIRSGDTRPVTPKRQ